jgi:hypothetical protein
VKHVGVLWAVAFAFTLSSCSSGSFVDKLIIVNPTEYPASVEVHGTGQGSIALATVGADSEMTIHDVYDQGDKWIFRLTYSDYDQDFEVSRGHLRRDDWRVTIPNSFGSHLKARGVVPPP